jgi:hypothetical protein
MARAASGREPSSEMANSGRQLAKGGWFKVEQSINRRKNGEVN